MFNGDLHMDLVEVKTETIELTEDENFVLSHDNNGSSNNEYNIHKCSPKQEMKPLSIVLNEELLNEKEDIHERNGSSLHDIMSWATPISLSPIQKNNDIINVSVDEDHKHFYQLANNQVVFNNNKDLVKLVENQSIPSGFSVDDSTPKGLLVRLTLPQMNDILWLKWRETEKTHGGIIMDENSTGKILTMIGFILKSVEESQNGMQDRNNVMNGGTLVVCPLLLLNQWFNEIKTKVTNGSLKVFEYCHGKRSIQASKLKKFDLVLTTYESIKWDYKNKKKSSSLFKIKWIRIILDESSNLQKRNSLACKSLCNITSVNHFVITGPLISNEEFFPLIKFIRCKPFDNWLFWKQLVNKSAVDVGTDLIFLPLLKSLVLRHTDKDLPTNMVHKINLVFSIDERDAYEQLLQFSMNLYDAMRHNETKNKQCQVEDFLKLQNKGKVFPELVKLFKTFNNKVIRTCHILVLQLRLRQICSHPSLIKEKVSKDDKDQQDNSRDSHLVNTPLVVRKNIFEKSCPSSKVKAVCNKVKQIMLASNSMDKIVIISQWCGMLNIIHNYLSKDFLINSEVFSPDVTKFERSNIIKNFNNPFGGPQVLLITLNYGIGCGDVYLSAANHILFVDSLNTQSESKICYRIHRAVQTKPINVYKFLCLNTIETKMLEHQANQQEFTFVQQCQ